MRCLTLAKALTAQGWTCAFITEAESFEFVPALAGYQRLDPDDFYNSPVTCDLLVVDHYDCDITYESRFRPFAKMIMVIDDLANRQHDCDLLLDQTYGRTPSEYKNLTPPHCTVLAGAGYALLRPEFSMLRPDMLQKRGQVRAIERILVNFGGNDQENNILTTLQVLHQCHYQGAIDVVYGVMAPHQESVEAYAATLPNDICFHVNPDMAALMCAADLAVGAAGATTWERCCLGLPSILIETADNQRTIIKNLCDNQAVIGSGYSCLPQHGLLSDFDAVQYAAWVERAASVCDGTGAIKLAQAIARHISE